MYNFLCQNVLVFQIKVLFTKIIETLWVLVHFESKFYKGFGTISSIHGLNYFKYIFWHNMSQKIRQEKF